MKISKSTSNRLTCFKSYDLNNNILEEQNQFTNELGLSQSFYEKMMETSSSMRRIEEVGMNVCVIGAGSFGTAVARIVADNVAPRPMKMWARRPTLAKSIQKSRMNSQYLPDVVLPDNIQASSDLSFVARGAQVVILAVPHQYIDANMLRTIAENACSSGRVHVVSLVKGIECSPNGELQLVSKVLEKELTSIATGKDQKFEVSVMMGANMYDQMGRDEFAESTLGCASADPELLEIFHDPDRFAVTMTTDVVGVEISGALKNIVALAAGYCEGLGLGSNTKAAVIRRGLLEIMHFGKSFFDGVCEETFLESAGIADLMTTCFGGRGRRVASEFVRSKQNKGWAQLEKEMLNGQQIPDWHNAQHIYSFLRCQNKLQEFPLFEAVYRIGFENLDPTAIVGALKTGPKKKKKKTSPSHSLAISFSGKRALVTGAGNGLGNCIARVLARNGARVIALDRDAKGLGQLRSEIKCDTIEVDLMDADAVDRELRTLKDDPPQLVVNCAGIAKFQPFLETDMKTFDRTYAINTRACIQITQIIAEQLINANLKGSFVHISSQSSTVALKDHLVYSSSKAALDHASRIQALELGKADIRVNSVRPTVVLTDLARQNWNEDDLMEMKSQVPLERLAEPVDVARTVCFLLSDQASMITGETIAVDGGRSMGGFGL